MGFRRSSTIGKDKQQWKAFVRAHFSELCEIGMPEHIFNDKDRFDHWLMHGSYPLDPIRFAVEDMSSDQRANLLRLLTAYADAGFGDPGVSIITAEERQSIWGRRER